MSANEGQPSTFEPVNAPDGSRWAHVEIFGHRQHDGLVIEVERFGAKMCRIEVYCRDGHLIMAPEYGGAALFGVTDLPSGERQARNRMGIRECPHPDHEAEKAAERARYSLPPRNFDEDIDSRFEPEPDYETART